MLLNAFVPNYIPLDLRHTRDYTGARGWCHLANLLFKKLETRGITDLGLKKEIGVEVSDDHWITIPSDCRKVIDIYYPPDRHYTEQDYKYRWDIVNGKIKIYEPFDKDDSPDSFTLSAGGTTTVSINDTDCTADLWNDYLLVLTDGTYSGDTILISDTAAAAGGVAALTFRHARSSIADSTAGYLTDQYLMLQYRSKYTVLSAATDEVSLDDDREHILASWLCMQAVQPNDKRYREYKAQFYEDLLEIEAEIFTPEPTQARPIPRSIPAFEDCDDYDFGDLDYIGDEDDS